MPNLNSKPTVIKLATLAVSIITILLLCLSMARCNDVLVSGKQHHREYSLFIPMHYIYLWR